MRRPNGQRAAIFQGHMLIKACLGLLSAVLSVGALAAGSPASSGILRVGGSGAVSESLRQMGPVFEAETGIVLEVVPSLGTSGANAAVADRVLGISLSGRDLKTKEIARGLRVAAVFRTPFGLATSRSAPQNLRSGEIAQLYQADKPMWPDGLPILIVLRPANQSDDTVLRELFPGMADALERVHKRSDLSLAATSQANADMGEKTKGSLVGASLTQVTTEKRNLRFVSIDGVAPSLESLENGSYPYGKGIYLVVPSVVSPEAAAFVAFLARPMGESLMRKAGIIAGGK
jgi:phosphate transport system substrate-binding protein